MPKSISAHDTVPGITRTMTTAAETAVGAVGRRTSLAEPLGDAA
jgi:hypothetical protein